LEPLVSRVEAAAVAGGGETVTAAAALRLLDNRVLAAKEVLGVLLRTVSHPRHHLFREEGLRICGELVNGGPWDPRGVVFEAPNGERLNPVLLFVAVPLPVVQVGGRRVVESFIRCLDRVLPFRIFRGGNMDLVELVHVYLGNGAQVHVPLQLVGGAFLLLLRDETALVQRVASLLLVRVVRRICKRST